MFESRLVSDATRARCVSTPRVPGASWPIGPRRRQARADLTAKGTHSTADDFIYELKSIVIHRGGAYGGHYFAYIKEKTKRNFQENFATSLKYSYACK